MSEKHKLEIHEQPKTGELRFRYPTEGDKAGSIVGINSTLQRVTYPSVRLVNCAGKQVIVVASCVTAIEPYRPHPHRLVGQGCKQGAIRFAIECASNDDVVQLTKIGIQCCKQKDVDNSIRERDDLAKSQYIEDKDSSFDLSTVRLCFQLYVWQGDHLLYCDIKVSDPIVDKKAVKDLVICRTSRSSGSVRGGDEVFIFCTGIKKDDIEVVFATPDESWKVKADFLPSDVHKQVAIAFKTPPYQCQTIDHCVDVNYYLRCSTKNTTSEYKTFRYFPEDPDPYHVEKKRKLSSQPFNAFVSTFNIPSSFKSSTALHSSQVGTLPPQCAVQLHLDNPLLNHYLTQPPSYTASVPSKPLSRKLMQNPNSSSQCHQTVLDKTEIRGLNSQCRPSFSVSENHIYDVMNVNRTIGELPSVTTNKGVTLQQSAIHSTILDAEETFQNSTFSSSFFNLASSSFHPAILNEPRVASRVPDDTTTMNCRPNRQGNENRCNSAQMICSSVQPAEDFTINNQHSVACSSSYKDMNYEPLTFDSTFDSILFQMDLTSSDFFTTGRVADDSFQVPAGELAPEGMNNFSYTGLRC